jgi:hypothetical protein
LRWATPGPFAVWHDAQLFCRIGKTSLENDIFLSTVVAAVAAVVAGLVVAAVLAAAAADVGAAVPAVVLDVEVDLEAQAATTITNTTGRTGSGSRRRMSISLAELNQFWSPP